MTIIASSNFTNLAITEEVDYGKVLGSDAMRYLPFTGESLQYTKESISSNNINSSRQVSDVIQTGFDVSGGIDIELAAKTFDKLMEGAMWQRWGIASQLVLTLTIDADARTISASGGTPFANIVPSQFIQLKNMAQPENAQVVQVESRSDTQLTIEPSYTLEDEADTVDALVNACMIRNPSDGANSERISYFIEKTLSDMTPAQRFSYSGCMVNSFSVSAQARAVLTGSFDLLGQMSESYTDGTKSTAPVLQSVGANILNSVSHVGRIMVDGMDMRESGIYFQSLDFTVSNNLRGIQGVGQAGNISVSPGKLSVSGAMNTYFADDDMYQRFVSGAEFTLSYEVLDENGEGYIFYFPRATISSAQMSASGNDQDLVENMSWSALMDPVTGTSVQIDRFQADYSTAPDGPTVFTG